MLLLFAVVGGSGVGASVPVVLVVAVILVVAAAVLVVVFCCCFSGVAMQKKGRRGLDTPCGVSAHLICRHNETQTDLFLSPSI